MAQKRTIAVVGVVAAVIILLGTKAKAAPPPIPPAEISLSDLTINPLEVNLGKKVTISVTATNTGGMKGSYEVILGGDSVAAKTVILGPGESKVATFKVTPTELGVYSVSVDGLTGSFSVVDVSVADIRLSNLVISPAEVFIGETVSISVVATNVGAAAGSRAITLTVS